MILMDIGMPGMSGYDVARHIREQPQYEDIKLVALTGWGQERTAASRARAALTITLPSQSISRS